MTKPGMLLAVAMLTLTQPGFGADDSRQRIDMPDMMREHMLGNMRDHLLALTEIQAHLGSGAFDAAAEVAESRLGMTSLASHNAEHMAGFMPAEMREIGTRMHTAASRFAIVAQDSAVDGDAKRAISALSTVMQQCVACHAAYRVH